MAKTKYNPKVIGYLNNLSMKEFNKPFTKIGRAKEKIIIGQCKMKKSIRKSLEPASL